jgi:hypothetical protein
MDALNGQRQVDPRLDATVAGYRLVATQLTAAEGQRSICYSHMFNSDR